MKKLFFILSILVLILVIYVALINTSTNFELNYLKGIQYSADFTKSINLSLYTLIILCAGIFSGAGTVYLFFSIQKDKLKAYKRELEKTSVSGEKNASKVSVLEAKIQTLEKAFTSVVDERTKLEVQIKNLNTEIEELIKKQS